MFKGEFYLVFNYLVILVGQFKLLIVSLFTMSTTFGHDAN
jgi:hypothetical protein